MIIIIIIIISIFFMKRPVGILVSSRRKSLAQCLSDPYVVESGKSESPELEGGWFRV